MRKIEMDLSRDEAIEAMERKVKKNYYVASKLKEEYKAKME